MICLSEKRRTYGLRYKRRILRLARRLVSQQFFGHQHEDVSFQVGDKNYILRFVLKKTEYMFPYSPYGGGEIVEITWFPSGSSGSGEGKWERTGDTSLGNVREVLRVLPGLITNWIRQHQPVGFYWQGNDPRLQTIWSRVLRGVGLPGGYVPSKVKPYIYVKENLQQYLDIQSLD